MQDSTTHSADLADLILSNRYASLDALYEAHGGIGFKIDLGCGYVKPDGFIGLDNLAGERSQIPRIDNAPDILMDLNKDPLPFPDNSCLEVRASHFLEHSDVMHVIDETFRILSPGGIFMIVVPYANSAEGMYPGHNIFFTEKWFHKNLVFQSKFTIDKEIYYPSEDYMELPWVVRRLLPFDSVRKFMFNACFQMLLVCKPKK